MPDVKIEPIDIRDSGKVQLGGYGPLMPRVVPDINRDDGKVKTGGMNPNSSVRTSRK